MRFFEIVLSFIQALALCIRALFGKFSRYRFYPLEIIFGDIAQAVPGLTASQRTYQIKKLVDQGMLLPVSSGSRQYTIGFSNNYLIRGVIKALRDQGFIPEPLDKP